MGYRTIVSTATVADHLGRAGWVVVDCRFRLDAPDWGEREYLAAHVPTAAYAHLDRDLSGPKSGTNGRHPLPSPDALRALFGRLGIGKGVQVIAYDQDNGMFASRLWWLLRWMGHHDVAVLDGGFARWLREGREVAAGPESTAARDFAGEPDSRMVADVDEVARLPAAPGHRLVDARAPERYRGEIEPIDRAAGHIPGARNHWFMRNVREDGTLRSPAELAKAWEETLKEAGPDRTIVYCGSGVTACQNLLALEHAGLPGARLYPGSWSEWSSDPGRPVEQEPPARS